VDVLGSQTGFVGSVQSLSLLQPPAGSHVPLAPHAPERHTAAPPSPGVQGPSPLAYPHSLSFTSHTPLWHTSVAAGAVHVPVSVGLSCAASVGIGKPLANRDWHACMLSSHHSPVAQSASALQPPAASHVPDLLHTPDWQTVGPVATVQGPSPLAYPHSLFAASQTRLAHTSKPASAVHEPPSVGFVWLGSVGIAFPLASCAVHVCALSLHQLPAEQSASTLHPPEGWQREFVLQVPERQTVPALVAVHGPSPLA
jgi:hypothetical protein